MTVIPEALAELIEPELLAKRMIGHGLEIDSARPTYVRYKPDAGAVIAVELVSGAAVHLGYLRYSVDPSRVRRVVAKAMRMRPTTTPLGDGVRWLDENAALFLFPNDYRVRRLRWVTSGRKIRHIVASAFPEDGPYRGGKSNVEILRYKPERRVVGRASLEQRAEDRPTRSLFYRLSADADACTVAGMNGAARAVGLPVAKPLGVSEDGRLHLEEAIVGEPLVDCVPKAWPDPEGVALMLHQIAKVDAPFLATVTASDDLARAAQVLQSLLMFHPGLEIELSRLLRQLRAFEPEPKTTTVIHGDLHLNQFMVGAEKLWLVDWERASYGNSYSDIGRLLAHPLALVVRRPELATSQLLEYVSDVVDLYRRLVPAAGTDLDFYTAVGLIDQALLVSRHLEPQWQVRSHRILALAGGVLSRGADTVVSDSESRTFEGGP